MATLPILEIPHPVLRQRAKKVRTIDRKVMKLAYDMVDTMHEAGGVGLAANQVGELRRIIVLQMPEEEEARIYFNPEILRTNGSREIEEGCLSLPGYRGIVNRSIWIRFQGTDHSDTIVKFKAEDLLSQALEHEVDHLNGILYTDHLVSHEKLFRLEDLEEVSNEKIDESDPSLVMSSESQGVRVRHDSPDSPASVKVK
jgi:peptide deformylase